MRDREIEHAKKRHPDLAEEVTRWRIENPAGTLEDAVRDLKLWSVPQDPDAQRLVWKVLRDIADPAALEGFPEMRAAQARTAR
jgi:hypothetical protein